MSDQFSEAPQKRNKWLLPVGIGCAVILCLCLVTIGGFYFLGDRIANMPFGEMVETFLPTEMSDLLQPTTDSSVLPTSPVDDTENPQPTAFPTQSEELPTGGQFKDETTLIDDFSSDIYQWPVFEDDITIIKYEDQAYSFQIMEPEYYDWSYMPVSFSPTSVTFDVWGLSGEQNGTFGVFCQFQDPDNYYYVEFDLETREYLIAMIKNNEYIVLQEPPAEDYDWLTSESLHTDPTDPNSITIECTLDQVSLFINGDFVNFAAVPEPFTEPGEMAFFVYAYSFAGTEGYKVFFDNVIVIQ